MKIQFIGATRTVTGSKYLLTIDHQRVLVDCGLFQGFKELRLKNWDKLPIDPAAIDAVFITHAHIDHTGYIPLLVKNGFTGPIYATEATYDLCSILLPDSGQIQEEDAKRANRYGYTKHHPALPLYTRADAEIALKQFKTVEFGLPYDLVNNGTVMWNRAGHILGAATLLFDVSGKKLVFTGDMGRPNDPVMKPPVTIQSADYLVVESTYGNRLHAKEDPLDTIERVVNKTAERGGTLLIPSFAVGRAQSMLYYLSQLKAQNRIPDLPVYLDSPMSINATKIMAKHSNDHKLTPKECEQTCRVAHYTNTPEESKEIDRQPMTKVIVSASGMMTGGRILHHLKVYGPDPKSTILITGFQAGGTRGARLLDGERELKIHGQMIPIRAEVEELTNTSAHADYEEMLGWLRGFTAPPRKVFITHGELGASESLQEKIEQELGWDCHIPNELEEDTL